MYSIIPLAGPDLVQPDGTFRPLVHYNGEPMIKKILKNRHWYKSGELLNENIIFVVRNVPQIKILTDYLEKEFNGCSFVVLSDLTKGALSSSLAGVACIKNFNWNICIDLVDIDYELRVSVADTFKNNYELDGLILSFAGNDPKYSYLETDGSYVLQCVEKRIISKTASAGTYFFKNIERLLDAARGSYEANHLVSHRDSMFICPIYNFLIFKKRKIMHLEVDNVVSLSKNFHLI